MTNEILTQGPALSLNWSTIATTSIIAGLFGLLVIYSKHRNKLDTSSWVDWCGIITGAAGAALAINYGITQGAGVAALLMSLAFGAMALFNVVAAPKIIQSWQSNQQGTAVLGALAWLFASVLVYGAGAMMGMSETEDAQKTAFDSSPQAIALDADIEQARARIASLTQFADVDKATAAASLAATLIPQLDAARAKLATCPPAYFKACTKPTQDKITELERQLGTTTAAQGRGEYLAAMARLTDLQKQRASLPSASVGTGKVGADIRATAWLTGKSVEVAGRIHWLVLAACLDLLARLFHIFAALTHDEKHRLNAMSVKSYYALLQSGYAPQQAAQMLANHQPATMPQPLHLNPQLVPQIVPQATKTGEETPNHLNPQNPHLNPQIMPESACIDCGMDFTKSVKWQKRCPSCSAKNKKGGTK